MDKGKIELLKNDEYWEDLKRDLKRDIIKYRDMPIEELLYDDSLFTSLNKDGIEIGNEEYIRDIIIEYKKKYQGMSDAEIYKYVELQIQRVKFRLSFEYENKAFKNKF